MDTKTLAAFPCHPFFIWEFGSENQAIQFLRTEAAAIYSTLQKWGCNVAILRSPGSQPLRIPAEVIEEIGGAAMPEPMTSLFYAHVALPPAVIRATLDLIENPRKAGISRASDGLQVVMSSGCAVLNPGHTLTEATTWKRADFWHPADLEDFNRLARQSLSDSNSIEFKWRSFDPALGMRDQTPGNWLEFVTRYRLIMGEDGQAYQLCENWGMREIAPAAR